MTRASKLDKQGRPVITEKLFQERVRQAAIVAGWRYYHTHNSMHSARGFPDCVLTKRGRIWFVEVKSETGKLRPEQEEWLIALAEVPPPHVRVWVLRPSTFDDFWNELKK